MQPILAHQTTAMHVVRLETDEEAAEVVPVPSVALEASILDLKELLGIVSRYKLPRHLKRIKKTELPGCVLVLVGHKHTLSEEDLRAFGRYRAVDVCVPKSMPVTQKQNTECQRHWPCYYFSREIYPDVCASYVKGMFSDLAGCFQKLSEVPCSGVCMVCVDGTVVHSEADTDNVMGHAVMKSVSAVSRQKRGYLCTGLDAFVYREPCTSCAMALVHGRISRVFFVEKSPQGPYSHLRLCYNRSINHRYPVYQIIVSTQ